MKLWRVVHVAHAADAWSGEGGRRASGRWHTKGRAVVYASEHAALALLEKLLYVARGDLRMFRLASATLPDALVHAPKGLPSGWDVTPHPPSTRAWGDAWLAGGRHVAVRVPSSLVPGHNVLVDPRHADFRRLVPGEVVEIPFAQRASA